MKHKLKCWEFFECNEIECPVYKLKELRCWLVSGTHCRKEIQGKFLEKIEMCLGCEPFRANVDIALLEETLKLVHQQFTEFRRMVEERDRELEHISLELALGLSEVFVALRQISSGDPLVRIPETSELELISKLKHIVNLTAENLAEIVDLSHEFAIGLAEHFDALHRVSTGDLSARVLGSTQVELLERLKKVTNEMIANVAREMTERMRTEKELREAQEEIIRKERLATLGRLSGSIAHELRNPLGVIDSSAYYLKKKLKDADEKVQEHLDRIKSQVGSSTATIESLLNLTRIKEPKTERLDLIAITSEGIAACKVPDTVNVIQSFPEERVLVSADGGQLSLAFGNVVTNSLEAMGGDGTLTVTISRISDEQAELCFADTGPGIDPENIERIFRPLFSTKAKGIGLGLSITKMVIDKHGGTIEARSEPGRGATIIVRLPLYVDGGKNE